MRAEGFSLFIEKVFTKVNSLTEDIKNQPPKEVLTLFRTYLEFQAIHTNGRMSKPFQKFLGKFIPDRINLIVKKDSLWARDPEVNYIIEEMLGILLHVSLQHVEQTDLLRNIKLFKKIEYSRLLNHYTLVFPKMAKF